MNIEDIHVDPNQWDEAISWVDGPQIIVGGPGSGKTEFLVRRAHHLVDALGVPPDDIVLLSFSRRGAAELRRRLSTMLGRSFTRITALTFHSLALQIIEHHGEAGDWATTPTPLTGPEQVGLVAELLASESPAAWPMPFRDLLTTRSFAAEVADFCLRAAERRIGPAELAGFGRADWAALPAFLERYRRTLVERSRIDYGSLQTEAIRLLETPGVKESRQGSPRYLFVDEYQDTTVAQAALLHALAGVTGNLTVAGDPYQSVYSFRGAEVANVADFTTAFGTAEAPARRIVLTTSFRVPARILEAAVRITSGAGLPGAAGPVKPAPGDGSVQTFRFDQQSHEAEWIAAEIQRAHLLSEIPYRRIAVLVRSKRSLLTELSRALDRRHIPHDRPGDRLVEHPAVRSVADLVRAAVGTDGERTAALRRLLLSRLIGLPLSAAREMEREVLRGGSWYHLLAGNPATADIAALIDDPTWATPAAAVDGFWHVWTTLQAFVSVVEREDAADDRAALASFAQALERLRDRDATATLARYFALAAEEDFEAEPLLEFRATDADQVTLTTLHQSKGLDFDIVFIADAREGILPDLRSRDSILGARHLSPSHGGNDSAYARFRIQEEMRLVYTAMCRARTRVVVTCTSTGVDLSGGAPSRVLALVANAPMDEAAVPPAEHEEPVTAQEAEAWLRRKVRDPALPAAERLAALAAATNPAPWQRRAPAEFAGVLEPGPNTGVTSVPLRMSPSRAESYMTCPRRYAFERGLGVGSTRSHYASIGGVIHDVLEHVETEAQARGDTHGTADEAVAAIADFFDPAEFGGEPWATGWRRRAEFILRRLYELWPGKGPAIALEHEVTGELDGVAWLGRIDRIERRGDTAWVIDYKTGTRTPSVADAATSLQLGFYARAITDIEVAGAEMWFPAIKSSKNITKRVFDMANLDQVESGMREAQNGIIGEDWEPRTGPHCESCSHRILCPAWPEGAEAYGA